MKGVNIPLVLDLWSLGHSAHHIAKHCGLPNHKYVARIIDHARELRDPRAVWHMDEHRRLVGKIPWRERTVAYDQRTYRGFEIVMLLGPVPECK